jgi:hypothetical protein
MREELRTGSSRGIPLPELTSGERRLSIVLACFATALLAVVPYLI